jgi:hypothetical protein
VSTLRVNNITDASGGSSALSVPGAAKAWVNFNGTGTVAIRASLNTSSITDNGVGDYTVNFTSSLSDANYSCVVTGDRANAAVGAVRNSPGPTASAARIATMANGSGDADSVYVNVAVYR